MWNKLTGKDGDAASSSSKRKSTTDRSDRERRDRRTESVVSSSTARAPQTSSRGDREERRTSRSSTFPLEEQKSGASSYATAPTERYADSDTMSRRSSRRDKDKKEEKTQYRVTERGVERVRASSASPERKKTSSKRESSREREKNREERREERRRERARTDEDGHGSSSHRKKSRYEAESTRGPADFPSQIASAGFSQFPGQDGATGLSGPPQSSHSTSDAHIANQFPGQQPYDFHDATPIEDGGHGLAAGYYGDQGQSVESQPGFRTHSPNMLVNPDEHLIAASANANPAQDTGHGSAADFYSGKVSPVAFAPNGGSNSTSRPAKPAKKPSGSSGKLSGAAALAAMAATGAALHHGNDDSPKPSRPNGNSSSFYQQGANTSMTSSYHGHSESAPAGAIPTLSTYTEAGQSGSRPGKQSSHSNAAAYAAGAAALGAAGAYALHEHHEHEHEQHQNGYSSSRPSYSNSRPNRPNMYNMSDGSFVMNQYGSGGPNGMMMEHKHRGPVSRLVDWWKDHEDVRKMEAYTQEIGVCRYCFDPQTSVYDAPRKHHYGGARRKKSKESLTTGRIEKQSRYGYASDEDRGWGVGKWIGAGLAGYGVAKVGKTLLGDKRDFDDTYSVKTGRRMSDMNGSRISLASRASRRGSDSESKRRSYSRQSEGIVRRDSGRDRGINLSVDKHGDGSKEYASVRRKKSHRSRSGSSSGSRLASKAALLGAGVGIAAGAAAAHEHGKSRRHSRSRSPAVRVRHKDRSRSRSSERSHRRRSSHSKKKAGFFTWGNGSSSSTDSALIYGFNVPRKKSSVKSLRSTHGTISRDGKKRVKHKSSEEKLTATLAGLAATGAAISAVQAGRHGKRHNADLVAVKERKGKKRADPSMLGVPSTRTKRGRRRTGSGSSSSSSLSIASWRDETAVDEDGWEDESVVGAEDLPSPLSSDDGMSALAYGDYSWGTRKARKSTDSLVSNASSGNGTDKWLWRWGGKKKSKRRSSDLEARHDSSGLGTAATMAGALAAGAAVASMSDKRKDDRDRKSVAFEQRPGPAPLPSKRNAPSDVSSVSGSMHTVYPAATSDPYNFDAVAKHGRSPSRSNTFPLQQSDTIVYASRPEIKQPQPLSKVKDSVYTTHPDYQPGYTAPSGPPVFSQYDVKQPYHETRRESGAVSPGSPVRSKHSISGKDAAVGAAAAAAGVGAIVALSKEDSEKERRRRRKQEDEEYAERARRRGDEEAAEIRRRQKREAEEMDRLKRDAERKDEEKRRAVELQRQQYDREIAARAQIAMTDQQAKDAFQAEIDARYESERAERQSQMAERELKEAEHVAREAVMADQERQSRVSDSDRSRAAGEVPHNKHADDHGSRVAPLAAGAGAALAGAVAADYVSKRENRKKDRRGDQQERDMPSVTPSDIRKVNDERDVSTVPPVIAPDHVIAVAPTKVAIDMDDSAKDVEDALNDPDYFTKMAAKKREVADHVSPSNAPVYRPIARPRTYSEVDRDFSDRYKHVREEVNNEEFWAPEELKHRSGQGAKVEETEYKRDGPNADVVFDNYPGAKNPPYEPSYAFNVKDGYGGTGPSSDSRDWVPRLNLIPPTPPPISSPAEDRRRDDVREAKQSARDVPPEPTKAAEDEATEYRPSHKRRMSAQSHSIGEVHVEPEADEPPTPPSAARKPTSSRVSFGGSEVHNYEVPSPEPSILEGHEGHFPKLDLNEQAGEGAARNLPGSFDDGVVSSPKVPDDLETPVEDEFMGNEAQERFAGPQVENPYFPHNPFDYQEGETPQEVETPKEAETPIYEATSPERTPVYEEPDKRGPFYQQPFYDTVSDIGLQGSQIPSRGTGRILGEVDTPGDERSDPIANKRAAEPGETEQKYMPSMPGAFDDEAAPSTSRDVPVTSDVGIEKQPSDPNEVPWNIWQFMSAKDRKKALKKGKAEPKPPVEENFQAPSGAPVEASTGIRFDTAPEEDEFVGLSSKERKKAEKAKQTRLAELASEDQSASASSRDASATRDASISRNLAQEPETPAAEDDQFAGLSKKDRKKAEKAKQRRLAELAATGAVGVAAAAALSRDDTETSVSQDQERNGAEDEWFDAPKKSKSKSKSKTNGDSFYDEPTSYSEIQDVELPKGRYDYEELERREHASSVPIEGEYDERKSKSERHKSRNREADDSPARSVKAEPYDERKVKSERRKSHDREAEDSPVRSVKSEPYDDGKKSKQRSHRAEADDFVNEEYSRQVSAAEPGASRDREDADEDTPRRKKKSRRSGDDYDDAASVVSSKSRYDDEGDEKKERRRKSRRSGDDYDDSASVASVKSRYDEENEDKRKEKKRSSIVSLASGLIGGSSSSKKDRDGDESRSEPGARSSSKKERDIDDSRSAPGGYGRSAKEDNEDDDRRRRKKDKRKSRSEADGDESFLGSRAEEDEMAPLPRSTVAAAGPAPDSTPSVDPPELVSDERRERGSILPDVGSEGWEEAMTKLVNEQTVDEVEAAATVELPESPPLSPTPDVKAKEAAWQEGLLTYLQSSLVRQRGDSTTSVATTVMKPTPPRPAPINTSRAYSPTSVPVRFRRPPRAGHGRSNSVEPEDYRPQSADFFTTNTPSPLAGSTPRSTPRHAKSISAESPVSASFRGGEMRPLYLVERNRYRNSWSGPEPGSSAGKELETLPSLPSSRASSVLGSSEEDLRREIKAPGWEDAVAGEPAEDFFSAHGSAFGTPEKTRDGSSLFFSAHGTPERHPDEEDDYLDSQQPTPRQTHFDPNVFNKYTPIGSSDAKAPPFIEPSTVEAHRSEIADEPLTAAEELHAVRDRVYEPDETHELVAERLVRDVGAEAALSAVLSKDEVHHHDSRETRLEPDVAASRIQNAWRARRDNFGSAERRSHQDEMFQDATTRHLPDSRPVAALTDDQAARRIQRAWRKRPQHSSVEPIGKHDRGLETAAAVGALGIAGVAIHSAHRSEHADDTIRETPVVADGAQSAFERSDTEKVLEEKNPQEIDWYTWQAMDKKARKKAQKAGQYSAPDPADSATIEDATNEPAVEDVAADEPEAKDPKEIDWEVWQLMTSKERKKALKAGKSPAAEPLEAAHTETLEVRPAVEETVREASAEDMVVLKPQEIDPNEIDWDVWQFMSAKERKKAQKAGRYPATEPSEAVATKKSVVEPATEDSVREVAAEETATSRTEVEDPNEIDWETWQFMSSKEREKAQKAGKYSASEPSRVLAVENPMSEVPNEPQKTTVTEEANPPMLMRTSSKGKKRAKKASIYASFDEPSASDDIAESANEGAQIPVAVDDGFDPVPSEKHSRKKGKKSGAFDELVEEKPVETADDNVSSELEGFRSQEQTSDAAIATPNAVTPAKTVPNAQSAADDKPNVTTVARDLTTGLIVGTAASAAFDDGVVPSSEKGKKKGKNSQQVLDREEEPAQEPMQLGPPQGFERTELATPETSGVNHEPPSREVQAAQQLDPDIIPWDEWQAMNKKQRKKALKAGKKQPHPQGDEDFDRTPTPGEAIDANDEDLPASANERSVAAPIDPPHAQQHIESKELNSDLPAIYIVQPEAPSLHAAEPQEHDCPDLRALADLPQVVGGEAQDEHSRPMMRDTPSQSSLIGQSGDSNRAPSDVATPAIEKDDPFLSTPVLERSELDLSKRPALAHALSTPAPFTQPLEEEDEEEFWEAHDRRGSVTEHWEDDALQQSVVEDGEQKGFIVEDFDTAEPLEEPYVEIGQQKGFILPESIPLPEDDMDLAELSQQISQLEEQLHPEGHRQEESPVSVRIPEERMINDFEAEQEFFPASVVPHSITPAGRIRSRSPEPLGLLGDMDRRDDQQHPSVEDPDQDELKEKLRSMSSERVPGRDALHELRERMQARSHPDYKPDMLTENDHPAHEDTTTLNDLPSSFPLPSSALSHEEAARRIQSAWRARPSRHQPAATSQSAAEDVPMATEHAIKRVHDEHLTASETSDAEHMRIDGAVVGPGTVDVVDAAGDVALDIIPWDVWTVMSKKDRKKALKRGKIEPSPPGEDLGSPREAITAAQSDVPSVMPELLERDFNNSYADVNDSVQEADPDVIPWDAWVSMSKKDRKKALKKGKIEPSRPEENIEAFEDARNLDKHPANTPTTSSHDIDGLSQQTEENEDTWKPPAKNKAGDKDRSGSLAAAAGLAAGAAGIAALLQNERVERAISEDVTQSPEREEADLPAPESNTVQESGVLERREDPQAGDEWPSVSKKSKKDRKGKKGKMSQSTSRSQSVSRGEPRGDMEISEMPTVSANESFMPATHGGSVEQTQSPTVSLQGSPRFDSARESPTPEERDDRGETHDVVDEASDDMALEHSDQSSERELQVLRKKKDKQKDKNQDKATIGKESTSDTSIEPSADKQPEYVGFGESVSQPTLRPVSADAAALYHEQIDSRGDGSEEVPVELRSVPSKKSKKEKRKDKKKAPVSTWDEPLDEQRSAPTPSEEREAVLTDHTDNPQPSRERYMSGMSKDDLHVQSEATVDIDERLPTQAEQLSDAETRRFIYGDAPPATDLRDHNHDYQHDVASPDETRAFIYGPAGDGATQETVQEASGPSLTDPFLKPVREHGPESEKVSPKTENESRPAEPISGDEVHLPPPEDVDIQESGERHGNFSVLPALAVGAGAGTLSAAALGGFDRPKSTSTNAGDDSIIESPSDSGRPMVRFQNQHAAAAEDRVARPSSPLTEQTLDHSQEITRRIEPLAQEADVERLKDVDFAATLAAGLSESGMDPDIVLRDSTYYSKPSTPPYEASAVDDDHSPAPRNRKKGRASRTPSIQSLQNAAESEPIQQSAPTRPESSFEDTLVAGLTNAGFDADTVMKEAASSGSRSPQEFVEPETESFFMTSSKKRKGKKATQAMRESIGSTPGAAFSEVEGVTRVKPKSVVEDANLISWDQWTLMNKKDRKKALKQGKTEPSPPSKPPTEAESAQDSPIEASNVNLHDQAGSDLQNRELEFPNDALNENAHDETSQVRDEERAFSGPVLEPSDGVRDIIEHEDGIVKDESAVSTKKQKKKKGKKDFSGEPNEPQAAKEMFDPVSEHAAIEIPATQGYAAHQGGALDSATDPFPQTRDTEASATAQALDDNEWAVPSQSKKKNKKNRAAAERVPTPKPTAIEPETESNHEIHFDLSRSVNDADREELPIVAAEELPMEEQAEQDQKETRWTSGSKKKDKKAKKEKKSTVAAGDTLGPLGVVAGVIGAATVATANNPQLLSRRDSKKAKKGKKGSKVAWEDETSGTGTSTPALVEEGNIRQSVVPISSLDPDVAATRIQHAWRAHRGRQAPSVDRTESFTHATPPAIRQLPPPLSPDVAARRIQSAWRARPRKYPADVSIENVEDAKKSYRGSEEALRQEQAARKIQSTWRNHSQRTTTREQRPAPNHRESTYTEFEEDMEEVDRDAGHDFAIAGGLAAAGALVTHHVLSNDKQRDTESAEPLSRPRSTHGITAAYEPTWSFPANRDSAIQVSPTMPETARRSAVRDSGFHESPDSPIINDKSNQRTSNDTSTRSPILTGTTTSSADPLRVSVEVGSDWDLTLSNPSMQADISEPARSLEASRALPDIEEVTSPRSEATGDVAFGSPLQSATKPRASELFNSSPSTREFATPEVSHRAAPQALRDSGKRTLETVENEEDQHVTPRDFSRSPGGHLDTIAEHSPEDSPLLKKSRHITDVGMPDHAIKALRRTETPEAVRERHERSSAKSPLPRLATGPVPETSREAPSSMDEVIARKPWPPVDENNETVDMDRGLRRSFGQRSLSGAESPSLGAVPKHRLDRVMSPADRVRSPGVRSPSVLSDQSNGSLQRFKTPEHSHQRTFSNSSQGSAQSLRRIDRSASGDLRARSRAEAGSAKSPLGPTSSLRDEQQLPVNLDFEPQPGARALDKGKGRATDMGDTFEAVGEARGSPMSPTRPPSLRKRQSMHIMDLESKVEQFTSENRQLQDRLAAAEHQAQLASQQLEMHATSVRTATDDVRARDVQLSEKDAEIAQARTSLQSLQQEIARLRQENEELQDSHRGLSEDAEGKYAALQAEHARTHQSWQESSRELDDLRNKHHELSGSMEELVHQEIALALADRNEEIKRLSEELESTMGQVKMLQQQILELKQGESFLSVRDEDYFDSACQQLCQHVQQWVLKFSKFSDGRPCRLSSDLDKVRDLKPSEREKLEDRLDSAVLDGSDVDLLLSERVQRRDVFMSLVMSMLWEHVFTRYLFGMDREQRQKLKMLEKTLTEIGPRRGVAQWRAITLTLLAKRPSFQSQRNEDTEAVMWADYTTLSTLLPPPKALEAQVQDQLRKVIRLAVDLSIEMRTQRAEYMMLQPLQPEYDANGDLVQKVPFNAALMNERSGEKEVGSNEEWEQRGAVVKIMLFPLVVKKGDDLGEGEDEVVICPAQVLVAKPKKGKSVRVISGAVEMDPRRSMQSVMPPESVEMGGT